MKTLQLVAFLTLIFLLGCKKETYFIIEGEIKNAPKETYARLYHALPTGNKLIDSVKLENGKFKFKAYTNQKDFFIINFTGNNYNIYLIVDSTDHIKIVADYQNLPLTYSVSGSYDSKLIEQLEHKLWQTRHKLDSLALLYNELINTNPQQAQKIDQQIQQIIKEQKQFSTDFVLKHYNNLAALPALSQYLVPGKPIFSPLDDARLYFMVDTALGRLYPRNEHVLKMHTFTQNLKNLLRRQQQTYSIIKPGSPVPITELTTINGDTINLQNSSFKLVFWASWCKPCLDTIKNSNYQTLITFSLDADKQQLQKAITELKLSENQVITDYKVWSSPIVKKFEVRKIPTVFYVRNGIIERIY